MRVRLGDVDRDAERLLPPAESDGSGVGINYVDATLGPLRAKLEDGRKVTLKRRGLRLTLKIGSVTGSGLLRRLEHGPDPRNVLRCALEEAARDAGAAFVEHDGAFYLDVEG